MRFLLVVVALVAACAAQVDPEDPIAIRDLLKTLKSVDEDGVLSSNFEEDKVHLSALKKTVISVNEHNALSSEWVATYDNQFSFETEAEKESHLGLNVSSLLLAKREFLDSERLSKRAVLDLAARADDTVDYTERLPPIKNQGGCGSCWTFGAAAALEYQLNRQYKSTPKAISEEQLLDCVYEGTRDGCSGGWPTTCYDWIKAAKSSIGKPANYIASMEDYPYVGKDGTCNNIGSTKNHMSGFAIEKSIYLGSEADVVAAVGSSQIGVLSVAISVVNSFYSYKSGIYSESSCNSINHAVDIVGYGPGYYKVRNSWGSSWGASGYINMKRGVDMCKIASYAHYPVVTGKSDDKDEEVKPTEDDSRKCSWKEIKETKLKKGSGKPVLDMDEAKAKCLADAKCAGISCKKPNKKCQIAYKPNGKEHAKFTAYKLICKK